MFKKLSTSITQMIIISIKKIIVFDHPNIVVFIQWGINVK